MEVSVPVSYLSSWHIRIAHPVVLSKTLLAVRTQYNFFAFSWGRIAHINTWARPTAAVRMALSQFTLIHGLSEMPRASSDDYPVPSDSHMSLASSWHKHFWLLCVHGPFRRPGNTDHFWGHKRLLSAGRLEGSNFGIIRVSWTALALSNPPLQILGSIRSWDTLIFCVNL